MSTPKLISQFLPEQVVRYLGSHVLEATLTRSTSGERDPFATSAGTQPTTESYDALGFVADYDGTEFSGTNIQAGDVLVILLGASLDGIVPQSNDAVTIEHPPESDVFVTFRIDSVKGDAVGAVYKCLARR